MQRFSFPRFKYLRIALYMCFAIVAAKFISLTLLSEPLLNRIADTQYHDDLDLAPHRGSIYDRRHFPLAISVRRPSLAINPRVFKPSPEQTQKLKQLLNLSDKRIAKIRTKESYFAWIKRKIEPTVAAKVLALQIKGLYSINEPFRYYPLAERFAHLVGYVGLDNTGLLGLEQRYENQLHGQHTDLTLIRDARNQPVFYLPAQAQPEQSGHDLTLTLDHVIQEISMEELAAGIVNAEAQKGFVIVSDPHTGQILAMANYPTFDPNRPRFIATANIRNTAATSLYEPGSIIKPLIVAQALELGLTRADTLHDCENGEMEVGNTSIKDDHPHLVLDTADTLTYSSNICIYKIALLLGAERLYELYHAFGLTSDINSLDIPGQVSGRISFHQQWTPLRFANVSFGQGFATTGIELINAYNVIANGGKLLRPYLLAKISDDRGNVIHTQNPQVVRQVLRPEIARQMRFLLGRVIQHGTGKLADPQPYSAGGKTSTAEIYDRERKRYSQTDRIAGFIGFAPLADPHITVYVSLHRPRNKPYYGGKWAAPVFANISRRVLDYLSVKKVLADVPQSEVLNPPSEALYPPPPATQNSPATAPPTVISRGN
ncbi:MAG: penicillin-binding protein 2 [Pseudomonadota bacterium]|nr:penicillin-binding protein 2 [Pseudomonadota bacterium]